MKTLEQICLTVAIWTNDMIQGYVHPCQSARKIKSFQVEVRQSDTQHLFSFTKRFDGFIVFARLVEFFAFFTQSLDLR